MKLNELLNNVKVEWKNIGDFITRFSQKQKNHQDINLVYAVSKEFGLIKSSEFWANDERGQDYTMYSKDLSNYNVIRKNMFAYNPARLNNGSISCLLDGDDGLLSPMYIVFKVDEKIVLPKYLLYYIKSERILQKIDSLKENGARFRFDFEKWNRIQIPIPPLEIQEKIVKILDKFTNYATELRTELRLRNKQYEYYRNLLLSKDYLKKALFEIWRKP